MKRMICTLAAATLFHAASASAQKEPGKESGAKPKGPPPALVSVATVSRGITEPMLELVGTIFFSRVSKVASEVEGRVDEVFFEEGRRVEAGQELVRLNTELLDVAIGGTRGTYEQTLVEIEEAEKSLNRIDPLYREGSVAESVYDEYFFKGKKLEKKAVVLKTALDRQLMEKRKKTILAPFAGLVAKKPVEEGEWVSEGGTVAVIADDREVDAVVNVPGDLLKYLHEGQMIAVTSRGRQLDGRFVSFTPRGDVATRTFAVKLRIVNTAGLVEGMEARAMVPSGRKNEGLIVPRDAVIDKFGRSVVFVVQEGAARMMPVTVTGHKGLETGVSGPGLEAGLSVVVKGNERLRDGQAVRSAP